MWSVVRQTRPNVPSPARECSRYLRFSTCPGSQLKCTIASCSLSPSFDESAVAGALACKRPDHHLLDTAFHQKPCPFWHFCNCTTAVVLIDGLPKSTWMPSGYAKSLMVPRYKTLQKLTSSASHEKAGTAVPKKAMAQHPVCDSASEGSRTPASNQIAAGPPSPAP